MNQSITKKTLEKWTFTYMSKTNNQNTKKINFENLQAYIHKKSNKSLFKPSWCCKVEITKYSLPDEGQSNFKKSKSFTLSLISWRSLFKATKTPIQHLDFRTNMINRYSYRIVTDLNQWMESFMIKILNEWKFTVII